MLLKLQDVWCRSIDVAYVVVLIDNNIQMLELNYYCSILKCLSNLVHVKWYEIIGGCLIISMGYDVRESKAFGINDEALWELLFQRGFVE